MPGAALDPARGRGLAGVLEDPVAFARGILGHDPWPMQEAILRSVATHPRTAVRACHSSSKTYTAAEAVLWWVTAFPDGVAVTTAPTWVQVERLLWGEIKKAAAGARIAYPRPFQTELRLGPGRYAMGLSTDEGIKFQGWHGRVLLILDEAPGVRNSIWEAAEGVRAGGDVRMLVIGNPTIPSGPFYDCFTNQRSGWQTFSIDALSTPNFEDETRPGHQLTLEDLLALDDDRLDHAPRPYLVSRRWVREKFYEWGERSPLWQARVRGQFPDQAEDALISLSWLEAAQTRELPAAPGDEWEAGVDVAGPGEDETVVCVRHGPRIVLLQGWAQPDPRGQVLAALEPYRAQLARVKVDSVGLGFYFSRFLEDSGYAGRVADVNVGEAAGEPEKYANKKAWAYWGLRQRFQDAAVAGLADERAISQLAGLRYQHTPRGQVAIESKEDARKRGVKSPDRAEAIMLAFIPTPVHYVF